MMVSFRDAWTRCSIASASATSVAVSPAITSSSSSSRGDVASARAISSRLRPAKVSASAGSDARPPSPTSARISCATARAFACERSRPLP